MVSLDTSPSQIKDEFDDFLINFEQLIGNIITKSALFVLITGDVNVRTTNWWKNDISAFEGTQVNSLTTFYGLN